MNKFILTIVFSSVCSSVFAGVYNLDFRRVAMPGDHDACRTFVEKAADALVDQAGVRIVDYGCQQDEFMPKAWDAIITYQSPAPLNVTSTRTISINSAAFYSNPSECIQQLATQKELFTKATGLEPLTAYCMLDISLLQGWETRVDGIGEPKLKPDSVGLSLWGTLVDEKSVFENFRSAFEAYGISIFEEGVYRGDLEPKLVIRLYGPEPYFLTDYNSMVYGNAETCSASAAIVDRILKNAHYPTVAFCVKNTNNDGATLHATALEPILTPRTVFKAQQLLTQYATLSECQKAAEGLPSSADVFGGVCAGFGKNYRVHLFSRP